MAKNNAIISNKKKIGNNIKTIFNQKKSENISKRRIGTTSV
jgi:hypothetical protein